MDRDEVINGVAVEIVRFISNRRRKLEELSHETMAVNPFLNALIMQMNGYETVEDLTAYLVGGHLLDGHQTGFGKLVDERILPSVFGTTKLTGPFRRLNPPFDNPAFGVIDHIIVDDNGGHDLLALKAGRWSIQLGQAKTMNHDFVRLIQERDAGHMNFDRIVIGVLYGTEATLTDKFRIARGIGPHDLTDIQEHVDVYAGRNFWAWLNDGEQETQEWVLDGFLEGIERARGELGSAAAAVSTYQRHYHEQLARHMRSDGSIDWHGVLREVNG